MNPRQASGICRGLNFLISDDWTPDQALAVYELLDDLRECIWTRYERSLVEQLGEKFDDTSCDDRWKTTDSDDEAPF